MFNHLHVHTEYSLLDGLCKVPSLISKARDLGYEALAITDHGNLYGCFEFWNTCKAEGIKPIIGAELYLAPRTRHDRVHKIDDKPYHITVLAKTQNGFKNLTKLVTLSHLEGFYRYPRVDKELLEKYHEGLIVLAGCMSGVVTKRLENNKLDEAVEEALYFKKLFGENFYLELQRLGKKESEELTSQLMKISKKTKIPVVATSDIHYLDPEDWEVQEIMWAVADGKTLTNPHRRTAWTKELYLKSPSQMEKLFKDIPEAIKNTQKIVDSIEDINLIYERVQPQYPDVPKGKTAEKELHEQAYDGAKKRYGKITKSLKERIDEELEIIHDKGYDHYFLVVGDIVKWAREKDIVVSCRGSVAGSVVAYSMEITNIDPIGWELYFERFLNPSRPSPPDIDLDLQDDARDRIISYVEKRYGKKNIAAICTFGRLQTKAAIRDVARVMEIDLSVADKLSKMVKVQFGKTKSIDYMMENDQEFDQVIKSDPQLLKLADYVRKIAGNVRHISVHACGYLITPEPVIEYVPLRRESRGGDRIITQLEFFHLEEMGLMKFDFLGLANLTIIRNAIKKIRKKTGIDFHEEDIPFDDKKTYELYTKGETHGVFQVEGEGMKKYLRKLRPTNMEHICFMLAAYRPGPIQYIDPYIRRMHKQEDFEYVIPEIEPIVKDTYGIAIYQEQVLRMAVDIAGYSMGEADVLRRAIGKKKADVMKAEEERFKKGILKRGHSKEIAEQLWEYMLPFADYGFNKAHSASYAVVSYWTAYLKANYPLEFMAALLEHHLEITDEVKKDIIECERMGIKILPPDINKSGVNFTIEGKKAIRLGLAAVKNVGSKPCLEIVRARKKGGEFKNFEDFLRRIDLNKINKKTIEYLIKVGAFDKFGDRGAILIAAPGLYDTFVKLQKQVEGGQKGLFDEGTESAPTITAIGSLTMGEPTTDAQKLAWENELLGVYITKHPLKEIQEFVDIVKAMDPGDITTDQEGRIIKVLGLIASIKRTITRKDNQPMALLNIEGIRGQIGSVIFPRIYQKVGDTINEGDIILIKCNVTEREGEPNLLISDLKRIDVDKAIKFAKRRRLANGTKND